MDNARLAVNVFDKNANRYQDRFMDVSRYQASFDLFCDSIPVLAASILEIACGPGNITRYLLQRRPDLKILGIDLSPNMLSLAGANNPTAGFELMDCRDISKLTGRYDGIMCGFCLPYLTAPEAAKLVHDAATLLQPGGILYLSTMEADSTRSGYETSSSGDRVFVNYHQANHLAGILEANSFTIIHLHQQPSVADASIADLVVIAQSANSQPIALL